MAAVLFSGSQVSPVVLPLMFFHLIQLIVCAVLAQRFARRPGADALEATDRMSTAPV